MHELGAWRRRPLWRAADRLSEGPNETQTENAGRTELYGAELKVDTALFDGFRAFASAGYARTEFVEFDSSAGDFQGNEFPGAPRWQGGIGLSWEYGECGPYIQLDGNAVDNTFRRANNDPDQTSDTYGFVNGRLGWRFRYAEIYVTGRNLTDRFYLTQRAFGTFQAGDARLVQAGVEFYF